MIQVTIDGDYEKALRVINDDYYNVNDFSELIVEWILEYLSRENGRLGYFIKDKYIEPKRLGI